MLALLAGLTACGGGESQDPLVDSFHIAYVKRPFPLLDPDNNDQVIQPDVRDPLLFYPGSDLYIRDHASARAAERNVTSGVTNGAGDVKDVDVSYDGKKLLFALKEPDIEGRLPEEQPTWNIWEYNIETDKLRRIIELDIFSEEGQDVAPTYLPDGRIIFSSTRQYGSKETLANEAKPRYTSLVDQETQHAMMLHVMNDDGTDIRQITFAQVIDMDPYVRSDGKVVFTRWDRFIGQDAVNIYSINPDGTDLQLLYGAHSHDSGPSGSTIQYSQIREYPDGQVLTILRPFSNTYGGGDIVLIDTDYFADYAKPTKDNLGIPGVGQTSLTEGSASADETPAMGGRFISVFPLWDGSNRSLVSWTPCRLLENDLPVPCTEAGLANPDAIEAEPIYNLYIYDPAQQTKLPIFLPEEGVAVTDVAAAQPRAYPRYLEDTVENSDEKTGILHIRSVYDLDGIFNRRGSTVLIPESRPIPAVPSPGFTFNPGTPQSSAQLAEDGRADTRTARYLRLIKPFVRPDRDDFRIPNLAFGRGGASAGLMEIIGYAPIEPDGSVKVRVPANVPFSFQIVDKDGRRIGERRHFSWLQVRKGETLECNGCHDHNSGIAHGRRDAIAAENQGAAQGGPFPGQEDAKLALFGETMAETRTRLSCDNDDCKGLNPTVDIDYKDLWTKEVVDTDGNPVISKGADFIYTYNNVFDFKDNITDPVSENCVNKWTEKCRMVINYVTHIDPLWSKPRLHSDEMTDLTCSQNGCHSPVAVDGTSRQVPESEGGSQLNLDNVSIFDPTDDANRLKAYRELLFRDNKQELDVDGFLVDILVDGDQIFDADGNPVLDAFGNPTFEQVTIPTNAVQPMIAGAANASRFFNTFVEGNSIHYDIGAGQPILSPSELKLISEWLDIGAQYYNDPFAVPD